MWIRKSVFVEKTRENVVNLKDQDVKKFRETIRAEEVMKVIFSLWRFFSWEHLQSSMSMRNHGILI